MPVGRQDPQKRTAREQRPMCVLCHSVEAAWKKGGSKPYAFRKIPEGLPFANGKDVYAVGSPRWCNACRLAYHGEKLPSKKLPITLLVGISMPISKDFTITHAGITTNPRQLLKHRAKYVQWRINGQRVWAAVESVCCAAATMLLCMGCGCSSKEAAIIKRRAKHQRQMVFIQSIMPFFAVERLKVRGKMQPCALVWVGEESHLEKDFSVDEYVASQFESDPRPQKGVDFMTEVNLQTTPQGSVFEWAKAPRFFNNNRGRYLFVAPKWDRGGTKFGCRYIVTKGPQAHGCSIGTFSTPDHRE